MKAKTKRHVIALYLPRIVALLIILGRSIVQKMTGNAWFATPDPPLPTVSGHLDKLEASEAAAKGGGAGAAAARDLDLKTVEDDLKALKAYVYKIIAQNLASASAIILSAGMAEKPFTPHFKPALAAFLGAMLGEIIVQARSKGRGFAYEWQVSTDGGTTWSAMGVTTDATTHYLGAVAGTTYTFRFRTTRKATTSAWSEPVHLTVH